jgi:citrate lyase subunit beta / citryl-CoA lyase
MDLLRTFLYVPADSPKKLAKARTVRPDAFIFDLEDGVAADRKAEARTTLLAELDSLPRSAAKICVRINSLRSGLLTDDLAVAVHPRVFAISVPKCEDPQDVALLDQAVAGLEDRVSLPHGQIQLHLFIETALGVLRLQELARSSKRVSALSLGAEDYAVDMGVNRTHAPDEFLVPRSLVAITAHAFRLHAISWVFTDINNLAGLIEDTKRGIELGFTGKTLIHPNQIEPVHQAFRPSEQEAGWAREVVEAFEAAKSKGSGVVVVRGRMVDEPILLQAYRILRYLEAGSQP